MESDGRIDMLKNDMLKNAKVVIAEDVTGTCSVVSLEENGCTACTNFGNDFDKALDHAVGKYQNGDDLGYETRYHAYGSEKYEEKIKKISDAVLNKNGKTPPKTQMLVIFGI